MTRTDLGLKVAAAAFLAFAVVLCGPEAQAVEYHACDCGNGADTDCQPGDDVNDGSDPSAPFRTYDRVRTEFGNLAAGDAVLFCRGGSFAIEGGDRWVNANCTSADPCLVGDYAPPWGSGDEERPILRLNADQHAFALEDGGDADHEEGYVFTNLHLICTDCGSTNSWGFFLYNDIDDVTIDHCVIDGFDIGVHLAGSNPCSADPDCDGMNDRLTLRNTVIINSISQGFLGAGNGTVIEGNYFENNGTEPIFDHNIYYSGAADQTAGSRIRNNTLFRSALNGSGNCAAVSLVVHGLHSDLIIEANLVYEEVGRAEPGCWGIAVDPGYGGEAEGFTAVVIRGNTVRNVGNLAIGVASCADCVIENNVVVHEQSFGVTAIAAPDRDRGAEDTAMTNVDIRNNSIYIADGGGRGIRLGSEGTGHALVSNAIQYAGTSGNWSCVDTDLDPGSYEAIDNNVCHFPNAGSNAEWEAGSGTSPDPLAAWRAASGFDSASLMDDPGFSAPGGPDFDLAAASEGAAIVDRGHPTLSAPTDFWGNARSGTPDVGAYEYGTTPPDQDAALPGQDGGESSSGSGKDGCSCRMHAGPAGDKARWPWLLLCALVLLFVTRKTRRR